MWDLKGQTFRVPVCLWRLALRCTCMSRVNMWMSHFTQVNESRQHINESITYVNESWGILIGVRPFALHCVSPFTLFAAFVFKVHMNTSWHTYEFVIPHTWMTPFLYDSATDYNTQQHTARHCKTLQDTAIHRNTLHRNVLYIRSGLTHVSIFVWLCTTHGSTMHHTTTHCSALQHTATYCNAAHCISGARLGTRPHFYMTLQYTTTHYNALQYTATHCNTLQHTATHCNTLQHTAT